MRLSLRPQTPPELSAPDALLWQELVQQRCGLYFSESRLRLLRQSLWERMRLGGIASYGSYYQHVTSQPVGGHEWLALLELFLNHETSFRRHQPSFTALMGHVLPELWRAGHRHRPLALWSAGCAMGQEPYSLAMTYLDFVASCASGGVLASGHLCPPTLLSAKILGTDISYQALDRARCGMYKPHEMRNVPEAIRRRYFTLELQASGPVYRVAPQVQALVTLHYGNLHDSLTYPPPYAPGASWGFEIIFCQNVLIYFPPASRLTIVQHLCQRLRPGGYLFLGPAEVVGLELPQIQPVRVGDALLYQRVP